MNNGKILPILFGIALTLLSLVFYLGSKPPLKLFFITMGILVIIFGFYTENKKIKVTTGYIIAVFSVNIIQWIILIYVLYYNPVYNRNEYLIDLIAALWVTLFLANQIRKKYLKSSQTKIDILKDKTKLILLITGIIILIGSLAGLIAYYAPIFLYGVTLGLMVFVYGFYHEKKEFGAFEKHDFYKNSFYDTLTKNINFSIKYARIMGFLIILQYIILFYFFPQISTDDWSLAMTLSLSITIIFLIHIWGSDLSIFDVLGSNYKRFTIGIVTIIIFIAIFSNYNSIPEEKNTLNQSNIVENETIMSGYSIYDTSYNKDTNISTKSLSTYGISFNYPNSWYLDSGTSNLIFVAKETGDSDVYFRVDIMPTESMSDEDVIKSYQVGHGPGWTKIANYKITIDNKTAYEDLYTYDDTAYEALYKHDFKLMRFAEIFLVKNDKIYIISLQAPDEDFDKEKANFAVILNSIKVQ